MPKERHTYFLWVNLRTPNLFNFSNNKTYRNSLDLGADNSPLWSFNTSNNDGSSNTILSNNNYSSIGENYFSARHKLKHIAAPPKPVNVRDNPTALIVKFMLENDWATSNNN